MKILTVRRLIFAIVVGMFISFAVAFGVNAQEQPRRVAVAFERFFGGSGGQEIVARALRQALREDGFEVVFTGRNFSRVSGSSRDFGQFGDLNVEYMLVINGSERFQRNAGRIGFRSSGIRISTRPRSETIYISGELLKVNGRSVVKSGEAQASASDGDTDISVGRRKRFDYRVSTRENVRFVAALNAAKELVRQLK